MKDKIINIMLTIFTFLFLMFPTSYGVFDLRAIFIFVPLFAIVYLIKKKIKFKVQEKYYLLIIIVLAILTRIGVVLLFNSYITQVSDFSAALSASKTLSFVGDYYRVFTHWIIYPTMLNVIYKIFGESQLVALLTNAIILVLVSIMVYKVTSKLFKNRKYGFIAAIIYILWPANILYTLIFTQEHFCQLILLLVIYLFLITESRVKYKKLSTILLYIIIGALLGLSTFFKNFAPVLILSFIIYYTLKYIKERENNKYIIIKILTIALIFMSYTITKNSIFLGIDKLVGEKVARNIIPCYLNVGLRDEGTYLYKNYGMYYDTIKEYNYDFDKANKKIMKDLIEYIKDKNSPIRKRAFFESKAKIAFSGDRARLQWIRESFRPGEHYRIINIIDENVMNLNDKYFITLVFLTSIGLIIMLKEKNLKVFLIYLILYGSLLLLLLVEGQNRYMYSIQPILCILSIPGIYYLKNIIEKTLKKE